MDAGDERALNQIKEVLIIDQLVQDLLYLSHFDRPSESHKTENFPLSILINKCVERSRMLGNSNNLSIEVKDKNWQDLNITELNFYLTEL